MAGLLFLCLTAGCASEWTIKHRTGYENVNWEAILSSKKCHRSIRGVFGTTQEDVKDGVADSCVAII